MIASEVIESEVFFSEVRNKNSRWELLFEGMSNELISKERKLFQGK